MVGAVRYNIYEVDQETDSVSFLTKTKDLLIAFAQVLRITASCSYCWDYCKDFCDK